MYRHNARYSESYKVFIIIIGLENHSQLACALFHTLLICILTGLYMYCLCFTEHYHDLPRGSCTSGIASLLFYTFLDLFLCSGSDTYKLINHDKHFELALTFALLHSFVKYWLMVSLIDFTCFAHHLVDLLNSDDLQNSAKVTSFSTTLPWPGCCQWMADTIPAAFQLRPITRKGNFRK